MKKCSLVLKQFRIENRPNNDIILERVLEPPEKCQDELKLLKLKLAEVQGKLEAAETTITQLQGEKATLVQEKDALGTKLAGAEATITQLQGEKATLIQEKDALGTKLAGAEATITQLQGEKATWTQEKNGLTNQFNSCQQEKSNLMTQLNNCQQKSSFPSNDIQVYCDKRIISYQGLRGPYPGGDIQQCANLYLPGHTTYGDGVGLIYDRYAKQCYVTNQRCAIL
ncbi:hypothetical protein ETB97_011750 [Aspergillus alliaceus]|uniref:Uncharacterized protein n=1 Tax=Petromyces alliaceus TaxID=209559 RepID=A0A8H6AAN7_PETAA|nr:hypothetical protein ETB97_011750 [Aspergillus burnettii]